MKVWILQTGEPLHVDAGRPRPMRAMNLANSLVKNGHSVTLWSSSFYHQEKKHRSSNDDNIQINENLEIKLIHSPGYQKNISLARLIDHFLLAKNLKKHLSKSNSLPDVAFIGYPPIETASVMIDWLKKNNVPTIIDIKDQWPVILVRSFPKLIKPLALIALSPYYYFAKRAIRKSDGISSMSNAFINWSLDFSGKSESDMDINVPLTSPNESLSQEEKDLAIAWWAQKGIKKDDTFRIMFVGSFSRAFDFDLIFQAANMLSKKEINCEFVLCGDGELASNLKVKAKKYPTVKIIEWIDRPKIIALSEMSSAYIAPYKNSSDFIMSVPNKIIDAFSMSCPLLSPLSGEVNSLIKRYKVGLSYKDYESLSLNIETLVRNKDLLDKLSFNSKKLYEKRFESNTVYNQLVKHLEKIAK